MFSKNKNSKNDFSSNSREMVRQDQRTSVKTTSAKTESTSTTVKSSTTIDSNRNKVTYATTRQTVTHSQEAHLTELVLRRTPTKEELEAMLGVTNLGQAGQIYNAKLKSTNNPLPQSSYRYESPKSPTIIKTQEINLSQNDGRTVTSQLEQWNVKLDRKNFKLSSPNSPITQNYMYKTDAKPFYEKPKAITPRLFTSVGSTTAKGSSSQVLPISPINKTTVLGTQEKPKSTAWNISSFLSSNPKSTLKPAVAYIFNHEIFDDAKNEVRIGSSEDVKALTKVLKSYNVKVDVIQDANLEKIKHIVKTIVKSDFTSRSAIIVVILSHGSRSDIISAKDESYNIDETILFPILANKTLNDKPKLFFIQACKGTMESDEVHIDAIKRTGSPNEVYKCYSTFEGYVAYRTNQGSFFIQTLCDVLKRDGNTEDIKDIMENVTRTVKQMTKNKQIPMVTTTLTKPYIFGQHVNH